MDKEKPDWAERIQRARQRSYDKGYAAGIQDRDIEIMAAYRLGQRMAEERIIKLLEERLAMLKLDGSTLPFGEHELRLLFAERCIELGIVIAFIKGENE